MDDFKDDEEIYESKDDFFDPEDDLEPEPKPKKNLRWLKITVSVLLSIALISNVLALWPKLFNSAAIEFLTTSRELSKNEDVQLYKESVVVVRSGSSKGTGFYFSKDGYIMTNDHVIDDKSMITVTFHKGESFHAEMIDSNDKIDIAILKIDAKEIDYPVLELEESWEPNQLIYIIGNPLIFNFIANKGRILGLTPARKYPMLMIDAPVYKGNSGSPVINNEGKVVGIIYATSIINLDGSQIKVGLAIPIEYVKDYFEPFRYHMGT